MNGVASIRYAGGGVMLPAQSPYDRETLLACLCHRLRQSGAVQLELDGRRWSITSRTATVPPSCTLCGRAARLYGIGGTRVDGPICAACLAALLRVAPGGSGALDPLLADDEPLRDAAGVAATSTFATSAPAARKGETRSWLRSI
jgi:hypothetical protein